MSTIPLAGFTTPFVPNSGIAAFDTDNVPEAFGDIAPIDFGGTVLTGTDVADLSSSSMFRASPPPVRISTEVQTDTQLQITLDTPVLIDPGTETHLAKQHWLFTTPSIVNTASEGKIIQGIKRLLNRISKINRGIN